MPACDVFNVALDVTAVAFNRHVPHRHGVNNVRDTQDSPIEYIASGGCFGGNSAGALPVAPGAPSGWYVSGDYGF